MLRVDPFVLDAIEVSRTRLNNRVVLSCAVDLRHVQWQNQEVVGATVTVSHAEADDVVRLAGSSAPVEVGREMRTESRRDIHLDSIATRELTHAAGGFFLVDLDVPEPADARPLPAIARLTVQTRAASVRARAAA